MILSSATAWLFDMDVAFGFLLLAVTIIWTDIVEILRRSDYDK